MKSTLRRTALALALAAGAALGAGTALADKPSWAGKPEKGNEHGKKGGGDVYGDMRFGEHREVAVREYYGAEFSRGRCPPGLAKKHNGCMPPGQAKKWRMGQPLPRDVVYYDLPPQLVVEIGVPPAGYRYVRVASDVLMIAIGTGLVVDAIEDLNRR
ncbi:MAG: RcnB family protein [Burkholderiales bacterium]